MQWIEERDADLEDRHDNEQFKSREDFLQLMAQADREIPGLIESLAKDIAAPDEPPTISVLRQRARQRSGPPYDDNMLVTTACAIVLANSPDLVTWRKVRRIAHDSWEIENWLHEAMAAHVQRDACARESYAILVVQLFKALESGALESGSERKNEAREGARSYWENTEYQLDELWWGLRGADFMNYEDEVRVFGLLSDIDPDRFQQLIADSKNPFLVDAAMLGSGAGAFSPRFSQWVTCAKTAPLAFEQDGRWTGAVLLPLLLVRAHSHLLAPGRRVPRYGADESEVAALSAQVAELAQAVVGVIAEREDAPAAFARWSTWLMRRMLVSGEKDFSDIRSYAFVDNALLDAIGKAMDGRCLIHEVPDDAAPWEAWCYQCVRASFAHSGLIDAPSFENFANQWQLSPEDWRERKGRSLLERAELHMPRDDMPNLSAQLLAIPIAAGGDFARDWQKLWTAAYYLREVLEFGSVDAGPKSYSDRSDASRLLLLLGCMGLACFDQATARLEASPGVPTEGIASLHGVLAAAVLEALHIDDTIQREKWQALLHHVALRRAYWDAKYGVKPAAVLFVEQQGLTLRDYLVLLQTDTVHLVAFLYACMLNQLDPVALRNDLRDASIDLRSCLDTLKRLNALRDRSYPINVREIDAIKPLIE